MRATRTYHKSSWTAVIAALAVIALVIGGLYWWQSKRTQDAQANTIDPNTASHLSEGLKNISAQDRAQAGTKEVHLIVEPSAGQTYTIIRPLEQLSAEDQAASKQGIGKGSTTTLEAFGLAKKAGEGDTARSLYNSGYFVYKLEGALTQSSTEAVVKTKVEAEIRTYNQGNSNPDSPYTYTNGAVQSSGDITIKTEGDETITLPVSKYNQTIKSKTNPNVQKQIVRVLAAAKLGDRLLLINMAVDDSAEFGKETTNLQAMADHIKLEIVK